MAPKRKSNEVSGENEEGDLRRSSRSFQPSRGRDSGSSVQTIQSVVIDQSECELKLGFKVRLGNGGRWEISTVSQQKYDIDLCVGDIIIKVGNDNMEPKSLNRAIVRGKIISLGVRSKGRVYRSGSEFTTFVEKQQGHINRQPLEEQEQVDAQLPAPLLEPLPHWNAIVGAVEGNVEEGNVDALENDQLLNLPVMRNFAHNQKIIDLPIEEILVLLSYFSPTIDIAPTDVQHDVCRAVTTVLSDLRLASEGDNEVDKTLHAKRCLLMWAVMFTVPAGHEGNFRLFVRAAAKNIEARRWDNYTYGFFSKKKLVPAHTLEQMEQRHKERIDKLLMQGELHKAAMSIYEGPVPITNPNDDLFKKLSPSFSYFNPNHEIGNIEEEIDEEEQEAPIGFKVDEALIESTIRGMHKGKSPGADGLRYEHLQFILGKVGNQSIIVLTCKSLLVWFAQHFINTKADLQLRTIASAARLVGIGKSNSIKYRSLIVVNSFRKVIGTMLRREYQSTLRETFGHTQLLGEHDGCNIAYSVLSLAVESFTPGNRNVLFTDLTNAFPNVSRKKCVESMKLIAPSTANFAKSMLDHHNHVIFACEGKGRVIMDRSGSVQGDTLSGHLFGIGTIDKFKAMDLIVKGADGQGLFQAFADDGGGVGPVQRMIALVKMLDDSEEDCGILSNILKMKILLDKTGSYDLALGNVELFKNAGFLPSNIMIHPDDVSAEHPILKRATELRYGQEYLGIPYGSDLFIQTWLDKKFEKLKLRAINLCKYENTQGQLRIFRYAFCLSITHLLRSISTTNPSFNSFLSKFEELKRTVLFEGIMRVKMEHIKKSDWKSIERQVYLHRGDGGLGIAHTPSISHAAFIAGHLASLGTLEARFPGHKANLLSIDDPTTDLDSLPSCIRSFHAAIRYINANSTTSKSTYRPLTAGNLVSGVAFSFKSFDRNNPPPPIIHDPDPKLATKTRQSILVSRFRSLALGQFRKGASTTSIARAVDASDPNVGTRFLDVYPTRFNKEFACGNIEMRVMLCNLLGVPLSSTNPSLAPLFPSPLNCDCKDRSPIDPFCYHCHVCAKDAVPTALHNEIRNLVVDLSLYFLSSCRGCLFAISTCPRKWPQWE